MQLSQKTWKRYKNLLAAIDKKAADRMEAYIRKIGGFEGHAEEVIRYAYALTVRYGEAAAAAACNMYDAMAEASGVTLPFAEPAETPEYKEVARAVNGTAKNSSAGQIPKTVGRLVKRTGADTTLKNAERDGAQFAWIPMGDTCAFCLTLASRGWQYMSKDALRNGHAEHIHANCDCQYAVRFNDKTSIEGYDPDKYREMYENAEGGTPQEKINSIRRMKYQENKDRINAQKRAAYAKKNASADSFGKDSFTKVTVDSNGTKNRDAERRFDTLPEKPLDRLEDLDAILNDYSKKESLWKHEVELVDPEQLNDMWGRKNRNCSITLRRDATIKTYIHELLHARSSSHFSVTEYLQHHTMEEGPVELLSEEICRANGIEFNMSYRGETRHLRIINSIINGAEEESVFAFSKNLFDIDLPERYDWLRTKIFEAYNSGRISEKSFHIANRHLVDLVNGK